MIYAGVCTVWSRQGLIPFGCIYVTMFMLQTNWLGDILLVVCKRWRKKDIPNIYTKLLYLFIYLSNMSGQALIPIRLIRLCRFDYINGWRTREDSVYGMKYSSVAQLSVGNLIIEVARGSFREYYTYFVWHSWTVVRFRNTYINIYILAETFPL